MNDDNRRIAKNTIYLYSRMIVMMLVTLYTSRIILEKLGVDDYGIYQAVGGIVGFLSFINGVLSTGTSRFLIPRRPMPDSPISPPKEPARLPPRG